MHYWHIQMNKPYGRDDENEIDPLSMLKNDPPVIGVGEWDDTQCYDFKKRCKSGEIVLVRMGKTPVALCEIKGDSFQNSKLTNKYLHINFREVKVLGLWESKELCGLSQGTFKILYEENSPAWYFIDNWYKKLKGIKLMQDTIDLLEANKNIILTGAPGTGKTYLAKQIAAKITGCDINNNENTDQFEFVQFHPSYDYTDFVEGLRPFKKGEDIDFDLKNGIFKDFCIKARNNYNDSKKEISVISKEKWLDAKFTEFVDHIQEKIDANDNTYLSLTESASITSIEEDAFRYGSDKWNYNPRMKFDDIKLCYLNDVKNRQDIKKLSKVSGLANQHATYYFYALDKFTSFIGREKPPKAELADKIELKKYVFIIDEINRGEISKIFGELFFSIDPGYRGEKGKVKTQYSNMQDVESSTLYIPENVYIIGTMNDIDRSVESFDFAMRRRFVWKEISAEESQTMFDSMDNDIIRKNKDEIIQRMNRLNNSIENTDGLNSHYKIGAAYFIKLQEDDYDFSKLWMYHIEPLLKEYLRGLPDSKGELQKLEDAYNLKVDADENN